VDAVLEGAVERSEDRVRGSVHLSQVYPERQLWANQYSRSIRDVMSIEDEIARAVIDETQTQLTKQRPAMTKAHLIDPQARDDYLRGRYFANGGAEPNATEPNLWTAVEYYKKAIGKDPNYALAYVGLAGGSACGTCLGPFDRLELAGGRERSTARRHAEPKL
jgi:hypothetical protein